MHHTQLSSPPPPFSPHRNAGGGGGGSGNHMSQGGGAGGGSGDNDRFRGRKSIMMRGGGSGGGRPASSSLYRSSSSSSSSYMSGGGGEREDGRGRSHKNVSYRREGDEEDREPRGGRPYMDYKGRDRDRSSSRERQRFGGSRPPPSSRPNVKVDDGGRGSAGWEDREGGGRDRRRDGPHWDADPPPHLPPPSGRPSLLQGMGRPSQPSRPAAAPTSRGDWPRTGSTSGGSSSSSSHHHQQQQQQQQHHHHEQKQPQEVLVQPLLCRPLDAGWGTRPAPWLFEDVVAAAIHGSLAGSASGSTASAGGAGASIFTFSKAINTTTNLGLSGADGLPRRRSPAEETFSASTASLSTSASRDKEPIVARASSLQSPHADSTSGGERLSLSTSGSVLEPRFQRSFSEASTGATGASGPGGRVRLGWGMGLARRTSTHEQPSPRVVAAVPSPSKDADEGRNDSNSVPTATVLSPPQASLVKDSSASATSTTAFRPDGSPRKDGQPLQQEQRSKEKNGAAARPDEEKKRSRKQDATKSRLRRLVRAYVRHVRRASAFRVAERMAAAAATVPATGQGKTKEAGKERPSSTGSSGKLRKERSSDTGLMEDEEGGARALKRPKSAQLDAAALAKKAEKEAALAKLEKFRNLSTAVGYPLCGLLPEEAMARALQATACVRAKQPPTEGEKASAEAEEVRPEMVRLPSRQDILSVLEALNAEVERLQEEVATVEKEVANATGGSAPYQAPWWSKMYATVIRLRHEASEQLQQRRRAEEDRQQEQQDAAAAANKKRSVLGTLQQAPPSSSSSSEVLPDPSSSSAAAPPSVPPPLEVGGRGEENAPGSTEGPVAAAAAATEATKEGETSLATPEAKAKAAAALAAKKRAVLHSVVLAKKMQVQRYTEQLADEYLEKKEAWKRMQPQAHQDEEALSVADTMRTTRNFAAAQRSSFPGGGGGDRASSRTGLSSSRGGEYAASEYDVALIVREIEEKEKMKQRMEQGGAAVPSMILAPEREHGFEFLDESNALLTTDGEPMRCAGRDLGEKCPAGCNCPVAVERQLRYVNPWSDMEKCIFVDKFLQFPKNFRKIASFLRRKSTHDVIEFYYDSKQCINYKALLKENDNRRRGLENVDQQWLKHAARQVGATVDPDDEQKRGNIRVYPPANDYLYTTFLRHPGAKPFHQATTQQYRQQLELQALQQQQQQQQHQQYAQDGLASTYSSSANAAYAYAVQGHHGTTGGIMMYGSSETVTHTAAASKSSCSSSSAAAFGFGMESSGAYARGGRGGAEAMEVPASSPRYGAPRPMDEEDAEAKKVMTKWTEEEKQQAIKLLSKHGKQWALISGEMGGSKKPEQIKNFFSVSPSLSHTHTLVCEPEGCLATQLSHLVFFSPIPALPHTELQEEVQTGRAASTTPSRAAAEGPHQAAGQIAPASFLVLCATVLLRAHAAPAHANANGTRWHGHCPLAAAHPHSPVADGHAAPPADALLGKPHPTPHAGGSPSTAAPLSTTGCRRGATAIRDAAAVCTACAATAAAGAAAAVPADGRGGHGAGAPPSPHGHGRRAASPARQQ